MATFWQHRIKCMTCGLHFTIHSDYREWFDQQAQDPSCPECSTKLREGGCMHWVAEVEGFIFEHVEGKGAHIHNFIVPGAASSPSPTPIQTTIAPSESPAPTTLSTPDQERTSEST